MKYNLTIATDDAAELAKILNALTGTTSLATVTAAAQLAPTFTGQLAPVTQPQTAPVTQPQTAPTAPSGEVDSTGLPWDERIHAKTKAKNANGTWRTRRGVDDAMFAAVEAQLRAAIFSAASTDAANTTHNEPEPFTPSVAPAPTPEQFFGDPAAAPQMQQPADPLAIPDFLRREPAAAQQPVPGAPLPTLNFQQLMAAISQGLRDKKIDNVYLQQLVQHFQITGIPALASTHANLIPNVVAELQKRGVV